MNNMTTLACTTTSAGEMQMAEVMYLLNEMGAVSGFYGVVKQVASPEGGFLEFEMDLHKLALTLRDHVTSREAPKSPVTERQLTLF